jgi:hypothetical protein
MELLRLQQLVPLPQTDSILPHDAGKYVLSKDQHDCYSKAMY